MQGVTTPPGSGKAGLDDQVHTFTLKDDDKRLAHVPALSVASSELSNPDKLSHADAMLILHKTHWKMKGDASEELEIKGLLQGLVNGKVDNYAQMIALCHQLPDTKIGFSKLKRFRIHLRASLSGLKDFEIQQLDRGYFSRFQFYKGENLRTAMLRVQTQVELFEAIYSPDEIKAVWQGADDYGTPAIDAILCEMMKLPKYEVWVQSRLGQGQITWDQLTTLAASEHVVAIAPKAKSIAAGTAKATRFESTVHETGDDEDDEGDAAPIYAVDGKSPTSKSGPIATEVVDLIKPILTKMSTQIADMQEADMHRAQETFTDMSDLKWAGQEQVVEELFASRGTK